MNPDRTPKLGEDQSEILRVKIAQKLIGDITEISKVTSLICAKSRPSLCTHNQSNLSVSKERRLGTMKTNKSGKKFTAKT